MNKFTIERKNENIFILSAVAFKIMFNIFFISKNYHNLKWKWKKYFIEKRKLIIKYLNKMKLIIFGILIYLLTETINLK